MVPIKTVAVTLPSMGESVTEGIVGAWRKQVGDSVAAGEAIVEIQTDKIDAEVPAPTAGRISAILAEEGQTVPVGGDLAEIEVGADGHGDGRPQPPRPEVPLAPTKAAPPAPPEGKSIPVPLPAMGESVTEGIVGSWRKQPGDAVAAGETLVEIDTDKVNAEIPSPAAGVLAEILAPEGETVGVGTVIARITASAGAVLLSAVEESAAPEPASGSTPPSRPEIRATPLARRRAALGAVDLAQVEGNGPAGLVRGPDVIRAQARPAPGGPPAAPPASRTGAPIKGASLALVQAMDESLTIPTATSMRTFEVAILDARRRQLNEALQARSTGIKVSFTHLVAFALTWAVREMPVFSSAFARVDGKPHKLVSPAVNLGLAVDVERGQDSRFLLVPVIRAAQGLGFADFRIRFEEQVLRTRTGALQVEDLQGATITLTNPGGVGTLFSVPRLMAGQSAIIAMGAVGYPPGLSQLDQASARQLGIRPVMTLASTYDHRVVQGIESGMLLRRLEELLGGADRFYEAVAESLQVELPPAAEVPPPTVVPGPNAGSGPNEELMYAVAAGMSLVKTYRTHGHLAAHLDPLGSEPPGDSALDPATVQLTPELMAAVPARMMRVMVPGATLAAALPHMRRTYCGTIAYEIEHISDHEERAWLRRQIESGVHRTPLSPDQQLQLFRQLAKVDAFERFLRKTYLGQYTFSVEGLDALIPMLEQTIELLAAQGTREVVLGMSHRGRLNVTARIVGRSLEEMIAEFESGADLGGASTGDVKYHYGASGSYHTAAGVEVGVVLVHNPSHLEVVDAVAEGRTRALQTSDQDGQASQDTGRAVPVLIHGDAAFTGQGVVTETLNLQGLAGYQVGGTVHLIANNQIGFTTDPNDGRSTRYASDVAKGYDIPIIHVNADDVEACLDAVRLAVSFRDTFHRDVLIDVLGYRRLGHNEGDEAAYTQPLLMARIRQHPPVVKLYGAQLVRRGLRTPEDVVQEQVRAYQEMADAHARVTAQGSSIVEAAPPGATMAEGQHLPTVETTVELEKLAELDRQLVQLPPGFNLNPKLSRLLKQRAPAFEQPGGRVSWAQAESLAFASLLTDGVPIRLTGQDTVRGTFSQRHLALFDTASGESYAPIQHLPAAAATFEVYNSPLTEGAALAFEYGYGVTRQKALVIWEAQYGDFINNAQVVIDQFVVSGQAKWNQQSRLTLLLPHGYEGSGPEHSSSRIERFLELSAEGNLRVAYPSTAAQYFHLLRLQALAEERRPLVVITPKSGLRLAAVSSDPAELTRGRFQPVLDDPGANRAQTRRLILSTGKVSHELLARHEQLGAQGVALARLELLYPFPEPQLRRLLDGYPELEEVIWAQEEPRNIGAFSFVAPRLRELIPERVRLGYAGRRAYAAPAEGSMRAHLIEQERLLAEAFERLPVAEPAAVGT
jgi:2-oxoglutarate dehydrogenase E1 component